MNTPSQNELSNIKLKVLTLNMQLERVADSYQEKINTLDQNNKSVFETNQEADLKEKYKKIKEAVKKLAEAEELLFDVIY